MLGHRIHALEPPVQNIRQLEAALHREWQQLSQQDILRLTGGTRRRAEATIQACGGYVRILDISVPGHFGTDLDISVLGTGHFGTDLDISVLGNGQFGPWMRLFSVLTTIVWYLLIVNIFVLVVL
jgi:hypothetical protein